MFPKQKHSKIIVTHGSTLRWSVKSQEPHHSSAKIHMLFFLSRQYGSYSLEHARAARTSGITKRRLASVFLQLGAGHGRRFHRTYRTPPPHLQTIAGLARSLSFFHVERKIPHVFSDPNTASTPVIVHNHDSQHSGAAGGPRVTDTVETLLTHTSQNP